MTATSLWPGHEIDRSLGVALSIFLMCFVIKCGCWKYSKLMIIATFVVTVVFTQGDDVLLVPEDSWAEGSHALFSHHVHPHRYFYLSLTLYIDPEELFRL